MTSCYRQGNVAQAVAVPGNGALGELVHTVNLVRQDNPTTELISIYQLIEKYGDMPPLAAAELQDNRRKLVATLKLRGLPSLRERLVFKMSIDDGCLTWL